MEATLSATFLCILLGGLVVFQVALAAGAPLGELAWGGQHRVLPPRLRKASMAATGLYAAFGLVALDRAGIVSLLPDTVSWGLFWIITAYFLIGIGLNAMSRSRPERRVMTPFCLVLFVLALPVALA